MISFLEVIIIIVVVVVCCCLLSKKINVVRAAFGGYDREVVLACFYVQLTKYLMGESNTDTATLV